MKILKCILLNIVGLSVILLPVLPAIADTGEDMYVQVRNTKVRAAPEFWASAVASVSYGDRLTVLSDKKTEGGWLKVRLSGGKEGFLHTSAVTSKKMVMRASGSRAGSGVDASDVVLAGKGFNKELEAQYAKAHKLNYSGVDQVERESVSGGELIAFMKAGKLAIR